MIHYAKSMHDDKSLDNFHLGDEVSIFDERDCRHNSKGIVVQANPCFAHVLLFPLFMDSCVLKK